MNVFLLGFMGSGKTTVGRKLARALSLPFTDLDAAIEAQEGRTVTEIFAQSGEAAFREIEARALAQLLESNGQVVALGGGTPMHNDHMAALNQAGITIYLRLKPGELVHRLSHAKQQRPLLAQLDADQLRRRIDELLKEREPVYNQAQLMVEGNNLNAPRIKELAERLLAYSR